MDRFWVVEIKSPACGPRLGPIVHAKDVKKEKRNLIGCEKNEKEFLGAGLRDLFQIFYFQR
jgi:hypothetical protein